MSTIFQASGMSGTVSGTTAKEAATKYYATFTRDRKCTIRECIEQGDYVVYKMGLRVYKDITKKMIDTL